jgi:hypothetical protein
LEVGPMPAYMLRCTARNKLRSICFARIALGAAGLPFISGSILVPSSN